LSKCESTLFLPQYVFFTAFNYLLSAIINPKVEVFYDASLNCFGCRIHQFDRVRQQCRAPLHALCRICTALRALSEATQVSRNPALS
jgi:hypothetical protein